MATGASGTLVAIGWFLRTLRTPPTPPNGNGKGYVEGTDMGTLKQTVTQLAQMQADSAASLALIERHEGKVNQILDALTIKISSLEAASDRIEDAVERMLGGRRRRHPNRRKA